MLQTEMKESWKPSSAALAKVMRMWTSRVAISSLILSICMLSLVPTDLKFAATWQTRYVPILDRVERLNYEASIAFASLALVTIGLIVIWTSYYKRMRWSWFAMLTFVCVYFVPVHLLDVLLDIGRVGWSWSRGVIRDAAEGREFALLAIRFLCTFVLMVVALILPLRDFFGRKVE